MWTSNISRKCRFHRIWNSCELVSSITESERGPFMRQKASSKALIQQRPNQAIVELFKANDQESRSNWILCKMCLLNSCSMLSFMKAEYPPYKKKPMQLGPGLYLFWGVISSHVFNYKRRKIVWYIFSILGLTGIIKSVTADNPGECRRPSLSSSRNHTKRTRGLQLY